MSFYDKIVYGNECDNMLLGCHVSFKSDTQLLGSVREALSYGCNTFMFYTGAPQNTMRSNIKDELTMEAYSLMRNSGIDLNNVVVHAPYIVNLANSKNFDFSVSFLINEVERCSMLGCKYLVLHPGSSVGLMKSVAIRNIIDGLNIILNNDYDVTICLETMAGKGSEIGSSFEEINTIIEGVKYKSKIGVCLDTCHINDAGYDVSDFDKVLDDFDSVIGLDYLKCIHVNDSKNTMGSKKDRHENFGFGCIGFDKMINIVYNPRIKDIPKILETPYVSSDDSSTKRVYPPYKFEIEMIKSKVFDKDLIDKIRAYYGK